MKLIKIKSPVPVGRRCTVLRYLSPEDLSIAVVPTGTV